MGGFQKFFKGLSAFPKKHRISVVHGGENVNKCVI